MTSPPKGTTVLARFHSLATKWQTYVVLLICIPLFMLGIGNISYSTHWTFGGDGNISWLLGPLALLFIVVFAIDAGVQRVTRK
jgi:hypothetical protein